MLISNDNNSNSGVTAVDSAGFDIMSKPLMHAQIANPVAPSIPSVPNSTLRTSAESASKEHDTTVDNLSSFTDAPVRDGVANHHSSTLYHAKESNTTTPAQPKKTMMMRMMLLWPLITKKLCAWCLSDCHKKDDTADYSNTGDYRHANERNATAHHSGENELMRKKTENFSKMMSMCAIAIMSKMIGKI